MLLLFGDVEDLGDDVDDVLEEDSLVARVDKVEHAHVSEVICRGLPAFTVEFLKKGCFFFLAFSVLDEIRDLTESFFLDGRFWPDSDCPIS